MKDATGNLVAACLAAACALGVAELVLQLTHPEILPYRLRLHDPTLVGENYLEYGVNIPFRLRTNYSGAFVNRAPVHTDEHGLRRTGRPIEDRADILCLGDSFTFGYLLGDRQTYPAALQQILDAERPGTIVANGGYASGFSFDSAYVRYSHDLHRLGARLVVVGIYPGNDYRDFASNVWTEVADDGRPRRITRARHVIRRWIYGIPILRESRLFVGLASAFLEWRMHDRIGDALDRRLDWSKVDTVVRSFAASTRRHGATLVFVFLREPGRVYASVVANGKGQSTEDVRRAIEAKNDQLKAILNRYGVPWFDDRDMLHEAKSELRSRRAPELMEVFAGSEDKLLARVFEREAALAAGDSIHYSWLTNVLLAQWLYERLDAGGLLPTPPESRAPPAG